MESILVIKSYIDNNLSSYREKLLLNIKKFKLSELLSTLNPYLIVNRNHFTVTSLLKNIADTHISASEEVLISEQMKGLAIFINGKVYNGRKSGIVGVDLEFDKESIHYIINIKSGPNWGNTSAIKKMIADFKTAKRILRTSNSQLNIIAVNGCCYGRDNRLDKGVYFKYCGQKFWEFISGDTDLYTKIIEPLGHQAKVRNDDFMQSYAQMINKLTKEFADTFCKNDGSIDWDKLVRFNSAINPIK